MPSPFPGMDPYLEAPQIWPDFHHKYASELSTGLNQVLPAPYYALLEMRPELAIVAEEDDARWIIPGVAVLADPRRPAGPGGWPCSIGPGGRSRGGWNSTSPTDRYDGGPYRRGAVDYAQPPDPPLSPADSEWAKALIGDLGG